MEWFECIPQISTAMVCFVEAVLGSAAIHCLEYTLELSVWIRRLKSSQGNYRNATNTNWPVIFSTRYSVLLSLQKRRFVVDSLSAGWKYNSIVLMSTQGNSFHFLNHSCSPNCTLQAVIWCGLPAVAVASDREICLNEELTIDYGLFWQNDDDVVACTCHSDRCRQYLNPCSSTDVDVLKLFECKKAKPGGIFGSQFWQSKQSFQVNGRSFLHLYVVRLFLNCQKMVQKTRVWCLNFCLKLFQTQWRYFQTHLMQSDCNIQYSQYVWSLTVNNRTWEVNLTPLQKLARHRNLRGSRLTNHWQQTIYYMQVQNFNCWIIEIERISGCVDAPVTSKIWQTQVREQNGVINLRQLI